MKRTSHHTNAAFWRSTVAPALAVLATLAIASRPSAASEGADQLMIVLDTSLSMDAPAGDEHHPERSRLESIQHDFPAFLASIPPETQVGLLSIGGRACDDPPSLDFPIGTPRSVLAAAVAAARPSGECSNVNARLLGTVRRMNARLAGQRRIALLSDFGNDCQPLVPTCEVATKLHDDYRIAIDVVTWVTDPEVMREVECIARVSGGTSSRSLASQVPVDPWPVVVLVAGALALTLGARIFYRHTFHVWRWTSAQAVTGAMLAWLAGAATLVASALAPGGVLAPAIGVAMLVGLGLLASQATSRPAPGRWALGIVLALGVAAHTPHAAHATDAVEPGVCAQPGDPARSFLVYLDVSGSTAKRLLGEMKRLLVALVERCARSGDEVRVFTFGENADASVSQRITLTRHQDDDTSELAAVIDDLAAQNPRATRTLFAPVAESRDRELLTVDKDPVVIVISDWKSDAAKDDATIEDFATRGVYALPGSTGWWVAVAGGRGLDLASVFRASPGTATRTPLRKAARPANRNDPCLLAPELAFETPPTLELVPSIVPTSRLLTGELALGVFHTCAPTRLRHFAVALRIDGTDEILRSARDEYVSGTALPLVLPVMLERDVPDGTAARVVLLVREHGVLRELGPVGAATILLTRRSYLRAHGLALAGGLLALLGATAAATMLVRRRTQQRLRRSLVVRVPGGGAATLRTGDAVALGGDGCRLTIAGVAPHDELALVRWEGAADEVIVQPRTGIVAEIDGAAVAGAGRYRLGSALRFITPDGHRHDVALHAGTARDLALSDGITAASDWLSGGSGNGLDTHTGGDASLLI